MFYDWRECAMSVHGATKHSFLSAAVLTPGSNVVFYYIDAWSLLVAMEAVRQARPASQDSRLLYYHIREIKTWLDINHITVHNNTYIFKNSKNSY